MKKRSRKLTFEEFKKLIAEELLVDEEKVVPEALFLNDLHVDSIKMVEMMLRLEEEGISIPLETAWQIQTVGDAYQFYMEHLSAGA